MTTLPQKNDDAIRRILGDNYLDLRIRRLSYEEDFEGGASKVRLVTTADQSGTELTVEGEGVGVIDAIFSGLMRRYAAEYESLKTIKLTGFSVSGKLDPDRGKLGSDAVGEVVLEVQNSSGHNFRFSDASRSVVASAAKAVLAAAEYFVNSERAFVSLSKAVISAKERKRPDLVAQYTRELAQVVESTSYAEIIERLKKEL